MGGTGVLKKGAEGDRKEEWSMQNGRAVKANKPLPFRSGGKPEGKGGNQDGMQWTNGVGEGLCESHNEAL